MGAAALFGEAEVVIVQLVFIEAEAEFHGGSFMGFGVWFQVYCDDGGSDMGWGVVMCRPVDL